MKRKKKRRKSAKKLPLKKPRLKDKKRHAVKVRKKVQGKTGKPSQKRVKKAKKGTFRDTNGRFISRKKWERKNLPKKTVKRKRKKGGVKGTFTEGKEYETPGAKYRYRVFDLSDFNRETVESVFDMIHGEPRPHPILFVLYAEYIDKSGNDGEVGTSFYRFANSQINPSLEDIYEKLLEYEVDQVVSHQLLATYSVVKE